VYYTKFECILKATLMPTNRTRGARGGSKLPCTLRLRGDAKECASDTLADSRVQKPKNFLAFFSRLLPPPLHREAEKEMERKFLVLLPPLQIEHTCNISHYCHTTQYLAIIHL